MDEKQQTKPVPTQCVVCGDSALYSYYGAIVCQSCKIFFRRNIKAGQDKLKCHFDGYCEVNLNTRHVCSYCRLQKCFTSGMQMEMIRASRTTTSKPSKRKNDVTNAVEAGSTALVSFRQPEQFPTLNLLRSDQSTLTVDQWNIISNLTHCYDEHSGLSIGEYFMREQYKLPLKMRYKTTAVIGLIQTLLGPNKSLYQNNRDFLSLSLNDRSILLDLSFADTGALSSNFTLHQVRLLDEPAYYDTIGMVIHPDIIPTAELVMHRIALDGTVIKLFLAILAFSTTSIIVYANVPAAHLSNIKEILRIQDSYIELTWRYLLYKYDFEQAVRCFSNLIRAVFATHRGLMQALDISWYTGAIDSLIEQTKETFILDD